MKRIKGFSIILVLIMMASMLLNGCGGKKDVDSVSSASKKEGSKTSGMGKMDKSKMDKSKMMSNENKLTMSEGKGYPVTVTDIMGNEVTFDEKPDKIAAVAGTFLGVLYDVGGESICTSDLGGGTPVDLELVKDLPTIGPVYKPDVEKIIELQPGVVFAQFGLQNSILPALKQSNIPCLAFHMRTYSDVLEHLIVMGRIIGNEDKAEMLVQSMEQSKQTLVDKLPEESKRAVILYATSKDVSVKLPNSIAGNVCEILKIDNIAKGCTPEGMGGESTPFSMEYIVEKDPDVILVTSMLQSDELAKEVIMEKLGKDPVWKDLRAVKEKKIVYLPQKYFLFNAGAEFVDGIEYMAKGVYPEIYGELNE